MILRTVSLLNFRNFTDRKFDFNESSTVIVGENARGKTNLLESIYFSLNGEGFRESKEEELIKWEETQSFIETIWYDHDVKNMFQIRLLKKANHIEKKYFVNKSEKTHYQYSQFTTKAVLFAPEHVDIVSNGPDKRRSYFDKLISISDKEYKKKLQNYENALRKRNKLLEFHGDENKLKEELKFWNTYLEEQATYIFEKRKKYIDYLNSHQEMQSKVFEIVYKENRLTVHKLEQLFDYEKRVRRTMIGPQKDDFEIYLVEATKKNVQLYGSRSEQRFAVFWLKLNEVNYLEEVFKKKPILLLDDVFSEFDLKNKQLILDLIQNYQTVITTTEADLIELAHISKSIIQF
jgi:DNA replication and repair protein RecF